MTNVEALKTLYTALGGNAADVENASTIVEVLNEIAAKYDGESDATLNADAIANIAAVAGSITPEPTLIEKTITQQGIYKAEDDDADGYSSVNVDIPINDNNAKFAATQAFAVSNSLEKIEIPEGVTSFFGSPAATFRSYNALKSVVLPSTLNSTGQQMFAECTALANVEIKDGLEIIAANTFLNCKALENISIPNSVTTIVSSAFSGCTSLQTITINKPEDSIPGAPWGAPETCQVIWNG